MPGEQRPDIEQMEKEGWVFSQRFENLEVTEDGECSVTIEFVK